MLWLSNLPAIGQKDSWLTKFLASSQLRVKGKMSPRILKNGIIPMLGQRIPENKNSGMIRPTPAWITCEQFHVISFTIKKFQANEIDSLVTQNVSYQLTSNPTWSLEVKSEVRKKPKDIPAKD
jgi:hypothetical protein